MGIPLAAMLLTLADGGDRMRRDFFLAVLLATGGRSAC